MNFDSSSIHNGSTTTTINLNASSVVVNNGINASLRAASIDDLYGNHSFQYLHSTYILASHICGWIMLSFCVYGAVGNALTVAVFSSQRMRSPINTLLAGLAVIDISVVLFSVPLFVLPALNLMMENQILEQLVTYSIIGIYPFAMSARTCSVWVFVLITFERYLAVCHPLKVRGFLTTVRARIALISIIVASIVYNFARFWEYQLKFDLSTGSPKIDFLLRRNTVYYPVYYTTIYLFTHFLIPFLILLTVNTYIIRTISQTRQKRQELSRQILREYKTTYMMVVIIVIFIITNTLPYVLNIIEAIDPSAFVDESTFYTFTIVMDISNALVVFNSATNSIIYYIFSQKYRECLLTILGCKGGAYFLRGSNSISESLNSISQRTIQMFVYPLHYASAAYRRSVKHNNRHRQIMSMSRDDNGSSCSCSAFDNKGRAASVSNNLIAVFAYHRPAQQQQQNLIKYKFKKRSQSVNTSIEFTREFTSPMPSLKLITNGVLLQPSSQQIIDSPTAVDCIESPTTAADIVPLTLSSSSTSSLIKNIKYNNELHRANTTLWEELHFKQQQPLLVRPRAISEVWL